jgi:DNA-binding LacI/PurR family transcriptional regulator
MKLATTIREVAHVANVSAGTVSRALRNEPGVSDATRQRILSVASTIGYDHRKLRQKEIRRVTFLLHRQHSNFAVSPFFSLVLHGAEALCRDRGIALSVLALGPADDVASQLRRHAPHGLIVAGFMEPEWNGSGASASRWR